MNSFFEWLLMSLSFVMAVVALYLHYKIRAEQTDINARQVKLDANASKMQNDLSFITNKYDDKVRIVHTRQLYMQSTPTSGSFVGLGEKLLGVPIYNFHKGFLVPKADGSTRHFRLYAVFNDDLTGTGKNIICRIRLRNFNNDLIPNLDFTFKSTSVLGAMTDLGQDAFSNMIPVSQITAVSLVNGTVYNHAQLYSYVDAANGSATSNVVWRYIELQVVDVYS